MDIPFNIAGFGFWMFLAAVVVAGIWYDAKKRESQQETLRRIVESGQRIDEQLIDKMLSVGEKSGNAEQDLKTGGLIVLFVAPGLAIFGWFLGKVNDEAFMVFLGIASLVGLVGVGLLAASRAAGRKAQDP